MQFLTLSWQDLHKDIFQLAEKIEKSGEKFDLIIAIGRGGLTISHILSDFLKLPITSFTISSYKDFKQHKTPEVSFHIGHEFKNEKILLVDDISDNGKTFFRGVNYLKEQGAKNISTASVFIKPWTTFTPDYYLEKTEAWVIYPYDMRETIEDLIKKFKEDKMSNEKIKEELQKIKIPQEFIERFLS